MINASVFKARFAEFNSIDDALIEMLLDESYIFIGSNKYQDTMVLYYTAHNLVVQQKQAKGKSDASQSVSNKSVGNVSVGYSTPTMDSSDLAFYNSTSYGQKYLEYKRALCVGNVRLI